MPPLPKKPDWFVPRITLGNVLSIVSMLCALVTVYTQLKLDVATAAQQITQVQAQVKDLETDNLPVRMSNLETTITINKVARDKAQDEIVARLDRMQDAIITLSNSMAALTATIKATEDRRP